MVRNSLRVLAVLAIVAVAGFGAHAGDKSKPAEGQATALIAIEGMTCGGCCTKVEAAVAELKGVTKVTADYEKGMATVTYDAAQVDVTKIVDTINEKTSFKAKAPSRTKKKTA